MAMIIEINPHLDILPKVDYREVIESQGALKDLTKENYERLRNGLKNHGLLMPFALWLNPGDQKIYLIDGHQRKRLFMLEKVEPFMIPYLMIPGKTLDEAKLNLLQITSQYGTVTESGFKEFTLNMPKDWIQETIHFDALASLFEPKIEIEKEEVVFTASEHFYLNIECADEKQAQELYERFAKEGLKVKIVT
jgi:hypothetical protein